MRTGIHLGEVILRRKPAEHVARGAKPVEVEGLAKPTAARIMSLADPNQILLTRGTFDLAHRAVGSKRLVGGGHGASLRVCTHVCDAVAHEIRRSISASCSTAEHDAAVRRI